MKREEIVRKSFEMLLVVIAAVITVVGWNWVKVSLSVPLFRIFSIVFAAVSAWAVVESIVRYVAFIKKKTAKMNDNPDECKEYAEYAVAWTFPYRDYVWNECESSFFYPIPAFILVVGFIVSFIVSFH